MLAILWIKFFLRVLKILTQLGGMIESYYNRYFRALVYEFLWRWNILLEYFCKSIQVKQELSVNDKRLKITMVKDLIRFHYNVIDMEILLSLWHTQHFKIITGITKTFQIFKNFMQFLEHIIHTNINTTLKSLVLLLFWQCFSCNLTHQINLIISLHMRENKFLKVFQEPFKRSQS